MLDPRDFFDFAALRRVCTLPETAFQHEYDMTRVSVKQPAPENFYLFRDNGSDILAVAHLDTVGHASQREARMVETEGGTVVYSRALDDRLGAYVLAELLPSMGLNFDLLLTVGEENGRSTARFFDPADHHERTYNWIIEFDRGGTDVVLYQFEDRELVERVEGTGARVERGIFSDISYMEHLGIKALNWGVGYRDYHGPRAHVWLDDMFSMVDYFLDFHETWAEVHMPHPPCLGGTWDGYPASFWGTDDWGTDDACIEEYADPEGCSGELEDTVYGPMCATHRGEYDLN